MALAGYVGESCMVPFPDVSRQGRDRMKLSISLKIIHITHVLPSNATAPNVVLKKSKTVMNSDTVLKVSATEQPGGGLVRVPGPGGGVLVGPGLGPKLMADKDGAGVSV